MTTTAPDEFAAFGHAVPYHRRAAALDAVRSMVPDVTTEDATALIDAVARAVERDQPYDALAIASGQAWETPPSSPQFGAPAPPTTALVLDVTGAYRLLAHLCTEPTP